MELSSAASYKTMFKYEKRMDDAEVELMEEKVWAKERRGARTRSSLRYRRSLHTGSKDKEFR